MLSSNLFSFALISQISRAFTNLQLELHDFTIRNQDTSGIKTVYNMFFLSIKIRSIASCNFGFGSHFREMQILVPSMSFQSIEPRKCRVFDKKGRNCWPHQLQNGTIKQWQKIIFFIQIFNLRNVHYCALLCVNVRILSPPYKTLCFRFHRRSNSSTSTTIVSLFFLDFPLK